jgi:hypothetical protein
MATYEEYIKQGWRPEQIGKAASGEAFVPNQTLSDTGKITTTGPTGAISLESLNPALPLKVPPATPPSNKASSALAGAEATSKTIQDYIKEQTPPETDLSKQVKGLLDTTTSLLPGLEGRGAAQAQEEEQRGVNQYSKELAGLNSQILQGLAEQKAIDADYEKANQVIEGKPITMGSIIGEQAQARKLYLAERNSKTADLGLLQARALGLQGQLEAAQKAADRAVELKFADRQSIIDTKLKQLELLYPELTKQEKTYADALANKLKDDQARIDEQKATTKSNIALGIANNVTTQFYNFGGEIRQTSTGKAYSTEAEFIKDTGMNVAQATAKGLITPIIGDTTSQMVGSADTGYKLVTYDSRGNVIKSVPVSGGGGGGTGTNQTATYYADQIRQGQLDITNVPEKYKDAVVAELNKPQTLDLSGATFNGLNVTLKDGSSMTFPTQQALDQFKKDNGLSVATSTQYAPGATNVPLPPTYGLGNFSNVPLNQRMEQLRKIYGSGENNIIKDMLINDGYPPEEVNKLLHPIMSTISGWLSSVNPFK